MADVYIECDQCRGKRFNRDTLQIKFKNKNIADILDSDIMVIQGDGIDQEILNEANVKEIDTVFALTNNDEVNILASFLAKRAGARRCVSLVNNNIYC